MNSEKPATFIGRLIDLRKAKKMTQQQMAKKLHISRTGYSSWEQGISQPSLVLLTKLCQILDVSADYLLGLSDIQHAVPPVSVDSCSVPRNPLDSLDPDLRSKAEGYIDSLREQQAERDAKQKEA